MVKKCTDCKHHDYANMIDDFRCTAPRMREVGWNKSPLPTYHNSATFQRMIGYGDSVCGPVGAWFEAKPATEDARELD